MTFVSRAAPLLADALARQRITTDLDHTFFVEAGAGTGKTTALVARIVNLIAADRVTVDRMAAITFTEAAAAELRDRVREGLERASVAADRSADEQMRCRRAAEDIDQAAISTIHAFAGQLLRTFPIEAGLPPGFATLDEIQQVLLFDERFERWFWRDALQEPQRSVVKRALLLGLARDSFRTLAAALDEKHDLLDPANVWVAPEPPSALRVAGIVGTRLTQLQRAVPYALDGEADPLVQTIVSTRSSARLLLAAQTDDDALSALLGVGRLRAMVDHPERWKNAKNDRNAGVVARETLDFVNARVRTTLDAHRSATLAALLGFLCDFALAGVAQRRADGVASFHDLLTWARDLLRDNASVRHTAQARYKRIFIDEFQDTDPLQAEIAFYLAAEERSINAAVTTAPSSNAASPAALDNRPATPSPVDWRDLPLVPGKLFVVGDPKQSIYRFRGADIGIYDDLLGRMEQSRERLTHNFRSVQPVVEWVNHHFAEHMRADPGVQPEYVPLAANRPSHAVADATALCGVRRVGGALDGSAADAAEAEARTFAALARAAIEEGWLVSDKDPSGASILRPASYRDICILLPARTHLRRLERALEDQAVPCRLEAGKLVLATQEVRDLLACLRAIEDPSDQVALVAALRSPAYACSDVDLLSWVEAGGELDHEHPGTGPDGPVREALTNLAEFHRRRLLLSPPALIETFIADRLLVASAFGEPRPRESWRRLRYVVSRARAFTSTGRHTLRAFVDWIEGLQRAEVRDPEAGSIETDEDAIHIQTIHGAKGLEYPIVFLGGLGAPARGRSSNIEILANRQSGRLSARAGLGWQTPDYPAAQARERDLATAESIRLLYVAATRAKDHLILSLFRGARAEDSHGAAIERHLGESDADLCPQMTNSDASLTRDEAEFLRRNAPVSVDDQPSDGALSLESEWLARRTAHIIAATCPDAYVADLPDDSRSSAAFPRRTV